MIKRLRGRGFLPFREEFDIPLDNQGLVLLRGDNRISNAANDNGSGKTSIVHALAWCFWGEDLLGRKADAVINRFVDGPCFMSAEMADAIGEWSVTRSRRPAGLETTGLDLPADSDMVVVQAAIDARLGFGMRTFRNAVIFGQGAFDRFSNADQAEQMRMLDEIQGIDFTDARKRTKAWRDDLASALTDIEYGVSTLKKDTDAERGKIVDLNKLRDSYDATKRVTLGGFKLRIITSANVVAAAQKEVVTLTADLKRLTILRAEQNVLIDLEAVYSQASNAEQLAGALQDEAGRDLRRFDEELDALLGKYGASACPTCRGKVDDAPKIRERFSKDRAKLARAATATHNAYNKTLGASATALDAVEAQQEKMREWAPGTEELSRIIMRLETETSPVARKRAGERVDAANREVQAIMAQIEKVEAEKWDGGDMLARAENQIVLLTAKAAREEGRLDKAKIAFDLAGYLVEMFSDRGIRSLLVDSVSDYMNERMAEHLDALTAGEASNVMSSQTTLKKGGAKERISFRPSWAWGGEGAGTGSAGQDRRVHLAEFAAIQDLSESRSARPFPLKVYDEPFDALDSRGKEMACAWVRAQAKERTVLLITHSEELAALAEPDQTWTVIHDENGARIER